MYKMSKVDWQREEVKNYSTVFHFKFNEDSTGIFKNSQSTLKNQCEVIRVTIDYCLFQFQVNHLFL